jgi:hypothetical protein
MPFKAMIDQLFTDPAMGADATFQTGASAPIPVRIMVKLPDAVIGFGDGQFHSSQSIFDIRQSEVLSPKVGDKIVFKEITYIVQSEPQADRERLVWRLDVVPE